MGVCGAEGVAEFETVAARAENVYLAIVEIAKQTLAGDAGLTAVMLPYRKADRQE